MAEIRPISNVNTIINTSSGSKVNTTETDRNFSYCLDKTQNFDSIFERAAEKYNVPVELLKAVGKAESDYNPNAVSKAGAQGVMQLMPATAKELGVVNSFDPQQNIMGGAKYLSGLLKKYDGDVSLTLAAYNAGSGNVRKYGGIPPFKETQNYVVKVMGFMKEDINIPAYGISTQSNTTGRAYTPIAKTYPNTMHSSIYTQNVGISEDNTNQFDALFSYDDYLKLLDILSKEDEEQDKVDKKNTQSDPVITPSYINLFRN